MKKVSGEYMLRMCIVCWNAWPDGREIKHLRVTEKGKRPSMQ
jgi:hypothetical protein